MYPISVISDEFKVSSRLNLREFVVSFTAWISASWISGKSLEKLPVELADNDIHQIKKLYEQYKNQNQLYQF